MKGKVKMFDAKKGYGFIRAEDGNDVFFHYSSLMMDGFKTANPGDEVEFEVSSTDKGLRASDVKITKKAAVADDRQY
ncbi:MAG TPA: cold-shock protein [Firmicutes bacterium]|nr:cold-shock protein [Bacillota bacterium]